MKYTPEIVAAARVLIQAAFLVTEGPLQLPADLQAEARKTIKPGPTPQDLMELWNSKADDRLPRCKMLTAGRRRAAAARLKEFPEQHTWDTFIEYINTSAWTLGEVKNDKHPSWKANFDFLVKPGAMVKFLEGQYTRQQPESARERYGVELDKRSETRGGK